jgi:Legume lectin domain
MSDPAWLNETQELSPAPRPRSRWRIALAIASGLALTLAVGSIAVGISNASTRTDVPPRQEGVALTGTPVWTNTPAPVPPPGPTTPVQSTQPPATPGPTTTAGPVPTDPNRLQFRYADFHDATGLQLNGSAHLADDRVILGSGQNSAGSVWSTNQIDPTRSFASSFTAQITKITDGIAFVIQSESPTALGSPGGGLGYGQRPGEPGPTITPSLAVELDTWDNSPDGFDPPGQHVAVTTNGDITRHLIWRTPRFSLYGDKAMDVTVYYNAQNHVLTVYAVPDQKLPFGASGYQLAPLFTYPIDVSQIVGTGPAYVGFTGATGLTTVTDPQETINSWMFAEQ